MVPCVQATQDWYDALAGVIFGLARPVYQGGQRSQALVVGSLRTLHLLLLFTDPSALIPPAVGGLPANIGRLFGLLLTMPHPDRRNARKLYPYMHHTDACSPQHLISSQPKLAHPSPMETALPRKHRSETPAYESCRYYPLARLQHVWRRGGSRCAIFPLEPRHFAAGA